MAPTNLFFNNFLPCFVDGDLCFPGLVALDGFAFAGLVFFKDGVAFVST